MLNAVQLDYHIEALSNLCFRLRRDAGAATVDELEGGLWETLQALRLIASALKGKSMSNPPDKYVEVEITNDPMADLAEINLQANQGYRAELVIEYPHTKVVLMGNYSS